MIRRGDKRGSHVGVVISFAIFVTFVIFLYIITQPIFREEQREGALMTYLENKLINASSLELKIMTVSISTSSGSDCVQLDSFIDTFGISNKLFVWNYDQISTPSGASGNNLRINRLNNGDEFFKVHYSDSFPSVGTGGGWSCQAMSEGSDYTLGITKVENYVFESEVIDMIDYYSIGYENLKNELGIPRSFEFGFGLIYSNGSIIETPELDISKNIYIKEIPIKYVSSVGKTEEGFFKLKVW